MAESWALSVDVRVNDPLLTFACVSCRGLLWSFAAPSQVLRVNIAKPLKHKLGAAKPVWSHDDWFKSALGEDQALADAISDAKHASGDDSLAPMAGEGDNLEAMRQAAKAKGLYVE